MGHHDGGGADPFDEVKRLVSLEDYFTNVLGAELRVQGDSLVCRSPWREERTPSLHIHPDQGYWKDFGGDDDDSGTIIDAVLKQEGFDTPVEAIKWLNDHYRLGLTLGNWKHAQKAAEAKAVLDKAKAEMDDPSSKAAKRARDYLTGRGFTQETWETFELSVDKNRGRIVIPISEKGGHAIGFSGRSLYDDWTCPSCGEKTSAKDAWLARDEAHKESGFDGKVWDDEAAVKAAARCHHCGTEGAIPTFLPNQHPKYKDSGGNWGPSYRKDSNLYNLFRAKRSLRKQKETDRQPFLLMEGFADVWACHQARFEGANAFNGNRLTPEQAGLLVKAARELHRWIGLIVDNDQTGRIQAARNIKALRAVDPDVDIRVLHSIDKITFDRPDGSQGVCKDAGDVLQHKGADALNLLLRTSWWSADEYRIRQILDGEWDKYQQMDLVRSILREARHTIVLDEIVPMLAEAWEITDESVVRKYMHDSVHAGANLSDSASLLANIDDMHEAAKAFLADEDVVTCDYEDLNDIYPGKGFRRKMMHMVMGRSGTGKTTLMANMLYQFIKRNRVKCVFFSLEMPTEQLFLQWSQIHFGVKTAEVEKMIEEGDPRLSEVKDLLRDYLTVVDNVPDDSGEMQPMTPNRILSMIHDINMISSGEPVRIVAIDHLGIMEPDSDASRQAQESSAMGWGAVVKRLFTITKQLGVTTFLLQQMNAQGSPPGEPVTVSSSRGSSEIIDYMDSILGIYRPELAQGLGDDERIARRGVYRIGALKNRYGPTGHDIGLMYDPPTRRITNEISIGIPAGFMPEIASADLSEAEGAPVPMTLDAGEMSQSGVEGFGADLPMGSAVATPSPIGDTPDWFFE